MFEGATRQAFTPSLDGRLDSYAGMIDVVLFWVFMLVQTPDKSWMLCSYGLQPLAVHPGLHIVECACCMWVRIRCASRAPSGIPP
jgi:hypothetical protein